MSNKTKEDVLAALMTLAQAFTVTISPLTRSIVLNEKDDMLKNGTFDKHIVEFDTVMSELVEKHLQGNSSVMVLKPRRRGNNEDISSTYMESEGNITFTLLDVPFLPSNTN